MKAKTRKFIEITLRRLKPLKQASFWHQDQLIPSPKTMAIKLHSELPPSPFLLCLLLLLPFPLLPVLLPSLVDGDGSWWWSDGCWRWWRCWLVVMEGMDSSSCSKNSARTKEGRRRRRKENKEKEKGRGWWLAVLVRAGGGGFGGKKKRSQGKTKKKTWRGYSAPFLFSSS